MNEDNFGLSFSNIPIINLRMEFNESFQFMFSDQAEQALRLPTRRVDVPLLTWYGMPEDLYTLMLQRAILGIEAYLPGALMTVSAQMGKVSSELFAQINNPFRLRGKSGVEKIYHRMPALVHPELSLLRMDAALYDRTQAFYSQVRNPLFHGEQFSDLKIEGIRNAFDHVARLYEWIDGWHDPEWIVKGFRFVAGVRSRVTRKS